MLRIQRLFLILLAGLLLTGTELPAALVVDRVFEGSAGARAGLLPGDVLSSWSRSNQTGGLDTPLDLTYVETEQAPRGEVALKGRRGDTERIWIVGKDAWRVQTTPSLTTAAKQAFEEGVRLYRKQSNAEALARWRDAASAAAAEQKVWIFSQAAANAAAIRLWKEADEMYAAALSVAPGNCLVALLHRDWAGTFVTRLDWAGAEARFQSALTALRNRDSVRLVHASLLFEMGRFYANRQDPRTARKYFSEAFAIQEAEAPQSLPMAASLQGIATSYIDSGDLNAAEPLMRRSLAIREELAPGTMDLAWALRGTALLAQNRGDVREAEQLYNRSLEISSRIAPEGDEWASTLNNLSNVLRERDLELSEAYGKKALAAREKLAPNSLKVAQSLNNLSSVAHLRGDLVTAEDYLRRALAITEKLAPGSEGVAQRFDNLGLLEQARGEWNLAESYHLKALAIHEKNSPGGPNSTGTLNNLGMLYQQKGDFAKAESYIRRAIALMTKHGLTDPNAFYNLGTVFELTHDFRRAEEQYRAALAVFQREAPGGLSSAEIFQSLGDVSWKRNDLAAAERNWQEALSLRERWAPGTADLAATLYSLARLARKRGQNQTAAHYFRRVIDTVEAQDLRSGGDQVTHARARSAENDYYRQFVDLLLSQNQSGEAFEILERSRARLLLNMLAERDLVMRDVPPDVERERRENAAEYDRTLTRLAQLSPKDRVEIEKQQLKLREISANRALIVDRLRQKSPRVANLRYPQPLGVKETSDLLDEGTVLLSYSVGESATTLFVIYPHKNAVVTFSIPAGEARLRKQVSTFRSSIQAHGQEAAAQAKREGGLLYKLLIAPAESAIAQSSRLVLIPDGPLHTLPFAALMRSDGTYLVQWKPMHVTLSATIYARLKGERRAGDAARGSLAIFADADYPKIVTEQTSPAELRDVLRNRNGLSPLPFSRNEALSISQLYGDRAIPYLGRDATEERAKSIGVEVRYLHFAVHGILDERFPLNSALVLTVPPAGSPSKENGLLQAWELFEQVRWDADLVVLSACQTGLGTELGGEGLMGLTRAIQYAGARSVMASLWSVDDRRTAEFMGRFYTHLHGGENKDEALRKAQIDFLKSPFTARPAYWAAFALNGDWR